MARSSGGRDTAVVDIEVKVKNLRGGWYQRWARDWDTARMEYKKHRRQIC